MFGLFKKDKNHAASVQPPVSAEPAIIKKPLKICSVDLRDGQQSLLATRLKTEDMIPILEKMDSVGYYCAEVCGGATFDSCIRFLNEDPWERIRTIKKYMPRTPLRMFMRGQNLLGYRHYPDDVVEKFVEKAAEAGVDIFLTFDILNDFRNCETTIRAVKKAGKRVTGEIAYATGKIYTPELYAEQAKWYESMGVESVYIEDGAGTLTPVMAGKLIRTVKAAVNIPVHIHCHSTGGMANMVYWEAIQAGVDAIDTDTSALSMGTAHPPVESFVAALKGTPWDTGLDLGLLEEINSYFLGIRSKYKEFLTSFTGVDVSVLRHEIPGGMLSNLESQMIEMGAGDKLREVLEEVHQVRKDFGYPPLGTPMSQIVGVQAAMNIMCGERYKMLPKESKDYIRGLYGKPPGEIEASLEQLVLGSEERVTCRPADLLEPAFETLKAEIGDLARSDEDVLTYAMFPQVGRDFLAKKYGQ